MTLEEYRVLRSQKPVKPAPKATVYVTTTDGREYKLGEVKDGALSLDFAVGESAVNAVVALHAAQIKAERAAHIRGLLFSK